MASRYFYQFLNMFEKGPVMLCANIAIGASGAPTLDSTKSRGIKSVTRTGAGAYDIVLEDRYQLLLEATKTIVSTTGTDAAVDMLVKADSSANATTPKIQITFNVAAGTATDLSNGAVLLLKLLLRNSSSPV